MMKPLIFENPSQMANQQGDEYDEYDDTSCPFCPTWMSQEVSKLLGSVVYKPNVYPIYK